MAITIVNWNNGIHNKFCKDFSDWNDYDVVKSKGHGTN